MVLIHVAEIHILFHVFHFGCGFLVSMALLLPYSALQNCHENSATRAENILIYYITGNNQRDDNALLAHYQFSSEGVLCSFLWAYKHSVCNGTLFQMRDLSGKN